MISLVPSESWGGFKWVRASARKWGVGPCPAQCIWQGSGFAADQTNAMLAVVRADDESLVPPQAAGLALSVARPLPTETTSLGFGGSPVGGGDKNSRFAFSAFPCGAGITTLGVRFMLSKRWTPAGHGGLFAVFMPPQCSPCVGRISTAGTHATPTPNRAHSGSHAETRRVLRVDGDDVLGSGIIDTIDPFQADQTVAVALAEGHRNTVSP